MENLDHRGLKMKGEEPPKALVKTPRLISQGRLPPKWRIGRGFSILEIREAGLTIDKARKLGIYVDKRRRSKHEINVKILKDFLKELGEIKA